MTPLDVPADSLITNHDERLKHDIYRLDELDGNPVITVKKCPVPVVYPVACHEGNRIP